MGLKFYSRSENGRFSWNWSNISISQYIYYMPKPSIYSSPLYRARERNGVFEKMEKTPVFWDSGLLRNIIEAF